MELRPLAYYRRNSEEYQRERNRGHQNSAFSHFSHRDQIVNSSVTPIHENNIQTVFQQGTYTVFENHRKKSHSILRAKRATFIFYQKCQKQSVLRFFENL